MALLRLMFPALALIVVAPGVAAAAVVSPLGGEVRVSTGQGFHRIVSPTEFSPGAQVVVSPEGSATIAYAGDCVVSVRPAGVTVIQDRPPCRKFDEPSHFGFEQSAVSASEAEAYGFTPKVMEATSKVVSPPAESPPPPPPPPPPPVDMPQQSQDEEQKNPAGMYYIVGGVALGAGVLAALLLSGGGDSPASP